MPAQIQLKTVKTVEIGQFPESAVPFGSRARDLLRCFFDPRRNAASSSSLSSSLPSSLPSSLISSCALILGRVFFLAGFPAAAAAAAQLGWPEDKKKRP